MYAVVANVFLIESLSVSNAYLLVAPEGLTLVDSGSVGEADKIDIQLYQAGYAIGDLRQIVITHAHDDHTGSAGEIVRLSHARVLAHKEDAPYIEGPTPLPYNSSFQRLVFWLSGRLMPKSPAVKVDGVLEDGMAIPETGGFVAVHAPGHTPGSLCLYHPERRILICGDVLFNRNPMTGRKGLREPLGMVTIDMRQARQSIRKLAGLETQVLLCGHGEPIIENAGAQLQGFIH
jgi:glyoxylase-like metal-dependent hydrolase (beta-lactamase superfamily II)